jgi:hypothetical protein
MPTVPGKPPDHSSEVVLEDVFIEGANGRSQKIFNPEDTG